MNLLIVNGKIAAPGLLSPEMGYWFIVLAAITWTCTLGAVAESIGLASVLATLALGSTLEAIARLLGNGPVHVAAGYLFIISAILAWWVASAMLFEETFGSTVISIGKKHVRHNNIVVGVGEPGVIRGQ
ncbi:MAG TPA: GPR1/FUN34/YaaH family transporter [Bryobacteraceae bacterium]|nr:GPR1/FUN34/YaaH family transporter [Bryobacteraceae bacterium]